MYFQEVIRKKQRKKLFFLLVSWRSQRRTAESQGVRNQESDPYQMSRGCSKFKDIHTADKRDKFLNKTGTIKFQKEHQLYPVLNTDS